MEDMADSEKYTYPEVLSYISSKLSVCIDDICASSNVFSLRRFEKLLKKVLDNTESQKTIEFYKFYNYFSDIAEFIYIISQNLIENHHFTTEKIRSFSHGIASYLEQINMDLKDDNLRQEPLFKLKQFFKDEILNENYPLVKMEEISKEIIEKNEYLYYRANKHFNIAGKFQKFNFLIENTLCNFKKNKIDKMKEFWINKYKEKINAARDELGLKSGRTKLIFCLKTMGPSGLILLLSDLVREVELDATIVIMRWRNKKLRLIGEMPNENDEYIMVYDINFTSQGILEVQETLQKNGCNLKAAIVIWDYITNSKLDLERHNIKLYTIFSPSELIKSENLEDSFSLAPLFYTDIDFLKLSFIDNYKESQRKHEHPTEERVLELFDIDKKIVVDYCKKCKTVRLDEKFRENIENINKILLV